MLRLRQPCQGERGIHHDVGRQAEEGRGDDAQGRPLAGLRIGEANCQTTAAADSTSTTESGPNPTSAADDAEAPAASATTASAVV
nr:hypothetical protein GCM10025730_00340 [Promicromonospora thailandica]BFF22027.1 hypothetical protein GCM10025730_55480 [Promicromonospora thailandica]